MNNLLLSTLRLPQSNSHRPALFRRNPLPQPKIGRQLFAILAIVALAAAPALAQTAGSAVPLAANTYVRMSPPVASAPTAMTPLAVFNGGAIRLEPLEPTQKLHVVLSIKPPHMAEEEQFIQELVTKGSPGFHKFLTPEQWNARFAPSAEDEQRVVDWVQSQGLTVTQRYPNRLLVEADGTVDTIEKAFRVTMNKYQVGDEVDFSNDRDPAIPADLTGLIGNVLGLNNVEKARRLGASRSARAPLPAPGPLTGNVHGNGDPNKAPANRAALENAGASPSNPVPTDSYPLDYKGFYAMDPDNVQSSEGYDYNALQRLSHCCNETGNAGGSPPESSIALIGYGAFNVSDVTTFFNAYGMAWNINWYCISNGGSGSTCPGVDDEAPLDVEYAGAMANSYGAYQNTAHIFEYEMGDNLYSTYSAAFNRILSDNLAKVVSTSYGWEENVGFSGSVATGTMHPIFNNMVGVGITLVASSGDSGASAGCGDATRALYPATDPDFIAAGGTQLSLNTSGIYQSENAWEGEFWSGACGSNHGGGTGGVSVLFIAPSWQSAQESPYYGWQGGTAYDGTEYVFTGGNGRVVPDISLTANPDVLGEWYYSGGSWFSEGGTSIVAPELAGFFAQENSYLDYVGNKCGSGSSACSPVGNAAPFIYDIGNNGAPHDPFYDITNGCTSNDVTVADDLVYWCAYSGYDLATGWGSANMLQLSWGINWWLIPAIGTPSIGFSGPATGSSTWYNTNQQVNWSVTDSGGSYPAPGVAGFTQGWDSIPSDPYSETGGGDGNSFYAGPQYPFATGGCLAFSNNGCAGNGGAQGCHTVKVEAWDNQGRNVTSTYGPLCYDSVAPTISIGVNPAAAETTYTPGPVTVTLTSADPGGGNASGIYKTYYAIDTGTCYPANVGGCSVYTGPFTFSTPGAHYIYYWTKDNAGNVSSEPYQYVYIKSAAALTSPTPSTVLAGSKVTFSWSAGGGAVSYSFRLGTTVGGNNIFGSGTVTATSATVSNLPLNGEKVYARLYTNYSSGGVYTDYVFTAASPAALTSPTPISVLKGPKVTFSWSTGGGATSYSFRLGTTQGGNNIFGSGTVTATSATVSNLPLNGEIIYARLYTNFASGGTYADYTFTAASEASLTSPTPSSVLTGSTVTFTWSIGGGASNYSFRLGTTVGGNNIYGSGTVTGTTVTVSNLPTNGETIYARLYTNYASGGVYKDYVFTAAP